MLSKNKKRVISLILSIVFPCVLLFAFGEDVHNGQLLQVLFGRSFTVSSNEQQNVEILEKALFLAIDEYNGYNLKYLDDLKNYGVRNLPSAQQIDFNSNQYHQRATHRGWDFTTYGNQALWETRKQLLLSTIDRMFNFQETEMIKRDSFGALIYYIHILGDHIGDSKSTSTSRIRLNGSMRGRNMERADIIWELEYHIPRLFRDQTNAFEYKMLMKYLQRHESQPSFEYATTISADDYKQLQSFAKEIMDKLIENIPALLKKESFFRRVFTEI